MPGDAQEKCSRWWEKGALLDCVYSQITHRDSFTKMPKVGLIDKKLHQLMQMHFSSAGWIVSAHKSNVRLNNLVSAKLISLYMECVKLDRSFCMIGSFVSIAVYKIVSLRLRQNLVNLPQLCSQICEWNLHWAKKNKKVVKCHAIFYFLVLLIRYFGEVFFWSLSRCWKECFLLQRSNS